VHPLCGAKCRGIAAAKLWRRKFDAATADAEVAVVGCDAAQRLVDMQKSAVAAQQRDAIGKQVERVLEQGSRMV
jgi:hypothetical protein